MDKTLSLWTNGVVMAPPNVPEVPVYEAPGTIAYKGLRVGLPDLIALPMPKGPWQTPLLLIYVFSLHSTKDTRKLRRTPQASGLVK